MRVKRCMTGAAVLFLALAGPAAVAQDTGSAQPEARKNRAFIQPGDPALVAPDELSPDLDSRLFSESFLVSLFTHDIGTVYDAYMHPVLEAAISRDEFRSRMADLVEAVGLLDRAVVTYLREEKNRYEGMDGGWSEFILIAERDPRIDVRVDFRRVADGNWKVYDFGIRSNQLERVQRARAAAEDAARAAKEAAEGAGDAAEPSAAGEEEPPLSQR